MEEPVTCTSETQASPPPDATTPSSSDSPTETGTKSVTEQSTSCNDLICENDESGIVLEDCKSSDTDINRLVAETMVDDVRLLGELDSLPAVDEAGAGGSDSGVEGCGRALSSGGGSRSCASSVVSCGSDSSSLAGAPRPRRRLTVTLTEPRRNPPTAPRPATAPRGPNLATRERARSREKPTVPEKPRPLTPKPRIRPTADLPNLVRESPALRAKPTKTSAARCRTPSSPCEEKRWPTNGSRTPSSAEARAVTDKYGTLPRRRRDDDADLSPRHEPAPRRPTVVRSASSRSAPRPRVRIYAEKVSQTVLVGTDIESALAGVVPKIDRCVEVSVCSRGVQTSARQGAALAAAAARAEREAESRARAEAELQAERRARLAAVAELERNSQRLLDLAGAGAGAGADGCLRVLEDQLKTASELAARQRAEIDALRERCNTLQTEASSGRETVRVLEAQLTEAEREAGEMQDFLAAETGALADSLRDAEGELARARADLDKSGLECRQLVRLCEQRRQEALLAAGSARGGLRAAAALARLAGSLQLRTRALRHDLPPPAQDDDCRSRHSDDNSADLLDSETEPCLVTDPAECGEEWWSGEAGEAGEAAETGSAGWSEDEHSGSQSGSESLRSLSAAIAARARGEAGQATLGELVQVLEARLRALLHALRDALPPHLTTLRDALRDKEEMSERSMADVVIRKLAELDSGNSVDNYNHSIETIRKQLAQSSEEDNLDFLDEEVLSCGEAERRLELNSPTSHIVASAELLN